MEFRENKSSPKLNTSVFGIYPLYKLDLSRLDMSNVFSNFPTTLTMRLKETPFFNIRPTAFFHHDFENVETVLLL